MTGKFLSKCPICGLERFVAHKARVGGNCRSCSKIVGRKRWSLINTKPELKGYLWERRKVVYKNYTVAEMFYRTKCLGCGKEVTYTPSEMLVNLKRYKNFTPNCYNCRHKFYRGKFTPRWKGGRYLDCDGYVYVPIERDSVYASMVRGLNSRYLNNSATMHIPEHRLVMAQSLGRPIRDTEHVHHINNKKGDNRLENLELVNATSHRAITFAETKVRNLEKLVKKLTEERDSLKVIIKKLNLRIS